MVAVRSAHLNQDEQFELENWVASLTREKHSLTLNRSISRLPDGISR